MKKIAAILLALLMVATLFTACGGKKETYEIALVTDVGNIDDKSFNEGTWNGVKEYAEENNKTYAYYRPTEDSQAARVETIGTAIEGGAKVVVCPGYLFETALYEVQDKYPETMFILIDGQPNDGDYTHEGGMPIYKTSANVHCILYQEEQAGFFAGYAAVMDGYRNLGFLGGMAVPAVIRYGYGFVQGAEAAAAALGLAAGDVNVKYWYCGVFAPSDDIKVKMSGWYSEGTEVVFACGGGIYISALAAAEEGSGKVIGVDVDQAGESELIITSAMKLLTQSVKIALGELYANDGKWPETAAGKTAVLGAAQDCVGLPTAEGSWRLSTFTVEQYNALYEQVKSGAVVVDSSADPAVKPATTLCIVDYQE
ncbi:MAG TPA: BMP family ABC transporter substrate-binding protein [Clostridia bacterium]|nr:BMP family ABC transporter substrate-binding protein [Clostridia bacterium]HOS18636.1 BMP family ABC transporter substrate-binding protein [Clostridia bacterium]HPK14911.1 BMP family ABC transporter substrate-binding protein [Clostridia bacterium]